MKHTFDLTPEQYHAGLDALWAAMPDLKGVQDRPVFLVAAERIKHLRVRVADLEDVIERARTAAGNGEAADAAAILDEVQP